MRPSSLIFSRLMFPDSSTICSVLTVAPPRYHETYESPMAEPAARDTGVPDTPGGPDTPEGESPLEPPLFFKETLCTRMKGKGHAVERSFEGYQAPGSVSAAKHFQITENAADKLVNEILINIIACNNH